MFKDTLLITSFFKKNRRYLNDFINSLNAQTDKSFDLLVSLDNFKYNKFFSKLKINNKIITVKEKKNIFKNKIALIQYAKKLRYKFIIFADSDDQLSLNRIKKSKQLLKHYNIVINEIKILNKNKNIFSSMFKKKVGIDFKKLILDGNIFGFTNTSINTNILKNRYLKILQKINKNIYACDWVFFGTIIQNEKKIMFTNKIYSLYRINNNQLSFSKKINQNQFKKIFSFHLQVFQLLKYYSKDYLLRYKFLLRIKKLLKNKYYFKKQLSYINTSMKNKKYSFKWHKLSLNINYEI